MSTLRLMLERTASLYSEKTAIVLGEQRLSYADLDEASNKVANALVKLGVKKGDRVAMLLSNSPEYVAIYFGTVKIGAVAVTLDVKYKTNELSYLFDDSLPKILVGESPTLEPLIPVLSRFQSIEHVIDVSSSNKEQVMSYQEIMATSPGHLLEPGPEPEDAALIAYTSGPTFNPRGVVLSHNSLVLEAIMSADGFQQTDNDIMMLYALPMHHVFGLVASLLGSVYKGSTVVIVPGTGLSIKSFIAAIEREKGTMFLGVPYIFALAIDIAEKEGIENDVSSLRLCSSSGAPLSTDIMHRFKRHFGYDIINCWGMTEAVCHVSCQPANGTGKPDSVGKPLPGWQVKVIDSSGCELPPNQVGELVIKGPIMKEYYHNSQATSEVIKDGWLHSGDIGTADEEGNLYITGRKKDMIIAKGQNIYPGDIESILESHPRVAEAAVLGIQDDMRGEVVGAVISLKEGEWATEQEIKGFCHEHLINYKVPKKIMFLDSLPKDSSGKIDKEGLRTNLSIPYTFKKTIIS